MRNSNSPAVFFSFLIGLAGLALLKVSWMVGGGIIAAALVMLFWSVRPQSTPEVAEPKDLVMPRKGRHIPAQQIVSSEFEITEDPGPSIPEPVAEAGVNVLLTAIRVTGRNLNAPVFYAGSEAITARDLVNRLYGYLLEHDIPVHRLEEKAPEIYDAFWEFSEEAMEFNSAEQITDYIVECTYKQLTQ